MDIMMAWTADGDFVFGLMGYQYEGTDYEQIFTWNEETGYTYTYESEEPGILDPQGISGDGYHIVVNVKLDGWRHSGFSVFASSRIQPREKQSLENLAAYLIRATFSQTRMDYSPEQATVLYRSKDGKDKKTYDALQWLAAMTCRVPERGKQTIRYYGFYANSVRGRQRTRGRKWSPSPPCWSR
jgi:hypothetical protein